MQDYLLTPGEQQRLVDFLNDGKGLYIEGNDFGYMHQSTTLLQMFGITWGGAGNYSHNVQTLNGQADTAHHGIEMAYTYGVGYPDQWVDSFHPNGADILARCQLGHGRVSAYAGPGGNYRAIHSAYWFGAMRNSTSTHTKAQVMAAYVSYLRCDSLVCGVVNEIPASTGGDVKLMLETVPAVAGRMYGILGTRSGTSPGWNLGSLTVPLNKDNFTFIVHGMWNTNLFQNFRGTLDASGRAIGTIHIGGPIGSSHIGTTMHYAFVLLQPINQTSNPVEVVIVP